MGRPARTATEQATEDRERRRRLLRGMAVCVAERGYAATTVADVVRQARVSKSTFYAHFDGRLDCYLALYSAAADNVLLAMREADAEATAEGLPWTGHVRAVNRAYLSSLASGGGLTRSLIIEAQAAGPAGLQMRRDVLERYARMLRRITDGLRRDEPHLRRLTPELALAVVGGTNELVMRAVEAGRTARLTDLAGATTALWIGMLTATLP